MDTCGSDDTFAAAFERCVTGGFAGAGYDCTDIFRPGNTVAFGVSGGADSMALLLACSRIRGALYPAEQAADCARFAVITVDHNIRPPQESGADAAFVKEFCGSLPFAECRIVSFEKGAVERLAKKRRRGIEEAARFLRYQAFEQAAADTGAAVFCLAHNRNDQLETLLLRFLQGSAGMAAAGIPRSRGIFVRPLLDISRQDIVRYLSVMDVPYRTDSTNSDNRYLRNKYRNELIPVLDSLVPGWDTAVLSGAEKAAADAAFIDAAAAASPAWQRSGSGVCMEAAAFRSCAAAVRCRLLYKAFDLAGAETRIPYSFVRLVCSAGGRAEPFCFSCGGITAAQDECVLRIYKDDASAASDNRSLSAAGFYTVIAEEGMYEFPFGTVTVRSGKDAASAESLGPLPSPVIIRSAALSDSAYSAGGMRKSVSKLLAENGIPPEDRKLIPVVEPYGASFVIPWTEKTGYMYNAHKCGAELSCRGKNEVFWIELHSET